MNNNFGENLKKIRKDNNLSQEQLAEKLNVSRQAISKWESGLAYPEMDKILLICKTFNLNIDDLLNKDIREIKGEEISKKNINNYVKSFLNFITDSFNMFIKMTFKSKCKLIIEESILFLLLLLISSIIRVTIINELQDIIYFLPNDLASIINNILDIIYLLLSLFMIFIIMIHLYKTRYLDYYVNINDENEIKNTNIEISKKEDKIELKEKEKIIIRDPKHSEYRIFNSIIKFIIFIFKIFASILAIFLSFSAIFITFLFIVSFMMIKSGLFFVGILIILLSCISINIECLLILLNIIFDRSSNKKILIRIFIISILSLGIGSGLSFIGTSNFEYVNNLDSYYKEGTIEFPMKKDLYFEIFLGYSSEDIEYIETDNKDVIIEYKINPYCNIDYFNYHQNSYTITKDCNNPFTIYKTFTKNLNNKMILNIDNDSDKVKIYTSKENIKLLKDNYTKYHRHY